MRNVWLILAFCFPVFLMGQAVDSVALKRVDSLIQVAVKLIGTSEFDDALKINAIAQELALGKFGRESIPYGKACFSRGVVCYFARIYPEAEKWYLEAKAIQGKTLGTAHPDYASTLNNLAYLYKDLNDFEKAEPLFLEAKSVREKAFGKESIEYAATANNLAILYWSMGNYSKAEPFYLEVRSIREKKLGKTHSEYASILNNLGYLYKDMAKYEQSESFYLEALAIREKLFGKIHASYASSLNNLANLYLEKGDYEKAEPLYLEAKAIQEKLFGKEHEDYAMSVHNLGLLYWQIGNYDKAESFYLESKAIRETTLGKNHEDYVWSLTSLGTVYFKTNELEKAESYFLEALAIREKNLGKTHPNYATSLSNLGSLYQTMGNYEKAEPLLLEAHAVNEKALGKTHLGYAFSLTTLATLYLAKKEYKKSISFTLEAKAIQLQLLGETHPDYISLLYGLGLSYWLVRDFEPAKLNLLATISTEKNLFIKASTYLSEWELSTYVHTLEDRLNNYFSFTQNQRDMAGICYDNILFHRSFVLNNVAKVRKLASSDQNAELNFNELKSYRRRLAAEYSKPTADRQNVTDLEEKANNLEKALTRTVAGFGEAIRQVNWPEIQQKLKPNEAAIEFIHYQFVNPNPTDSLMYAALVLRPGMKQPAFIPLFEAKQLDTLLKAPGKTKPEYINQLYALSNPKKSLYQLIWKPLEQELVGASTVYYSPSGLLHRLNLNAIPVPTPTLAQNKNQTLAERYQLIELGSTRQLVMAAPKTIVDTTNAKNTMAAQLYGSIQYEMDSSASKVAAVDLNKNTSTAPRGIGFGLADSTLRGGKWGYLKWTEVEINTLELILTDVGLKADVHKAYAATEESFKRIGADNPSPRIVHLATHGFFFPDPKSQTKNEPTLNGANEPVFKISEHPMIRSGLILSGGNHAWQTGKPLRPGFEDGILTAYEISQMNLSNTELVVLSACETGLGDIQGNEGVYGLQRAFKIAGAKYLVMSLWQVPDFHTQELMTTFYSKWLEYKMSIPDAFRAAQKVMKDKFKEPFYWAGFVLVE